MATGSDGAGTASPPGSLGRDGGFCPGNKKEKGWGSLGGFFSGGGVLPLFFFSLLFFSGSGCWSSTRHMVPHHNLNSL